MSPLSPPRIVRLAIGSVAVLAAGVVATGLVVLDLPGIDRAPIALDAQAPASTSIATCAGPVLALGREAEQAALLTDAEAQRLTIGSGDDAEASQDTLAAPDVTGGAGPTVVTAPPSSATSTGLAAAGSSQVAQDDVFGFAASACSRAAMESWLVAGSATTGAGDLIVLANPGEVAAQVTLTLFGAVGQSAPAAGADLVVPAGTQRVIPLAAVALGEENPIIRVTAAQSPVAASLQATLTRVLDPAGVDQVAAVGAPEPRLVIPGVAVTLAPGDEGASDVPVSLRLLAPSADGSATVTVRGAAGPVGEPRTVPLLAGIPLQLDLDGLPVDTYTVEVVASTPVTGAVWSTTGFDARSDFAWSTPAPSLSAPTLVAVAPGPSGQLTLVSDGAATVTIDPLSGGAGQEVALSEGRSVTVDVAAGATYRLSPTGGGGFRAAVSYHGGDALAGYPVPAGDAEASAVTVYPR